MEQVNAALRDVTVLDVEGKPHPLSETWADRAAVLVFLRHFG